MSAVALAELDGDPLVVFGVGESDGVFDTQLSGFSVVFDTEPG